MRARVAAVAYLSLARIRFKLRVSRSSKGTMVTPSWRRLLRASLGTTEMPRPLPVKLNMESSDPTS
ncbi:MAG: hypothetical protein BWY79_01819 [Actinobacteria bacterium ADurb.Bin444]|nr:MAG: hypothetical protein BWY79_01819 [Actinobacteria bacterium ADurb.Bin444]